MRGMNGMLLLKAKNADEIIYRYSCDTANFHGRANTPVDGEIRYIVSTDTFELIKKATLDDDGGQAKWLSGHLRHVILQENCPEKRFIAIG